MGKSEFELYHEDEVLAVPTNRINTTKGSPTERMMRVFDKFLYDDIEDAEAIERITALDNMVGGQLDDYGDDWGLLRQGKSDEVYRFLLKLRSVNRTSQGTPNEVIRIISQSFDVDPREFQVKNDYQINDDGTTTGKPFHVSIENLPLDDVGHPELIQIFMNELKNSLVLGVTLSRVSLITSIHVETYVSACVQVNEDLNIG
ncbi:hypothetical protein LZY01_19690 [Levilactobacillus zymae]|uniref:DUF2313 domain-containing protein n=1 Tax=Levilactobacillus zymae TaxID=267363 RepID=A0ABQ0X0P0_9LACO|nr:hypothetical protein [Levilactobacillus zymae]KRL16506.1 hypothetical protein FD38_GL001359 [Levilactobacillus zymae DSM 19395]QFR60999.1 hypothetical protein LZ395_05395 [Levilactobacillus zymae]GEO72801.1 hypothetical protein LZY01_19690 [Levilactobacillus zymae]